MIRPGVGHGLAASALLLAVTSLDGCSGASATIGNSGIGDSGPTGDASTTSDGSASTDGSSGPLDAGVTDGGEDAGLVVHEKPAPGCNDLAQRGALVAGVGDLGSAPAQVPIATITSGLYVLVSEIDYGGAQPIDPLSSSRTTVFFTATRQYYFSENVNGGAPSVFTLDWKITNNRLVRKVVCAQSAGQIGTVVDYRVDAQPKGFIIYVPSNTSGLPRLQAFRYDRVE